MKRNTMLQIFRAMANTGGGERDMYFMLSQVVFLSGVPRMTVYRYLNTAQELGFVESRKEVLRGDWTRTYAITNAGRDFAGLIR
jgi:DNA-binding IclR family transcriptional regulator